MSRSFRKFAVFKIRERTRKKREKAKSYANRAVRRRAVLGGRDAYRRVFSGEVEDTRIVSVNEKELKRKWDNGDDFLHEMYDTYAEALMDWKRSNVLK